MVRTKADRVPTKAVGAKLQQKVINSNPSKKSNSGGKSGKSYSGGNSYHPRETPDWQKPITNFLSQSAVKETDTSTSISNKASDTTAKENAECCNGENQDEIE